jgi:hypothetical protein
VEKRDKCLVLGGLLRLNSHCLELNGLNIILRSVQ